MDLASERCEACQPGAPQVPTKEQPALLESIPGWDLVEVKGVQRLKRVVRTDGWETAVQFTNQVAALATEADHHPSILLEWGKVTIQWWTHAIRGLHRNDFIMAARVNDLLDSR
jgi:4a-hydroxytetrahydrobiopterin dehydratase